MAQELHRKEVKLHSQSEEASSSDDEGDDDKEQILLDRLAAGDRDIDDSDLDELDEDGVGLMGKLKTARLKQLEETLSEEQRKSEKE